MQKQKGISTLVGVIIIVIVAVVLFGGVFAYQHFSVPKNSIPSRSQSQNVKQDYQDFQHNSEHIYLEKTVIIGKDSLSGAEFTKEIIFPKVRGISNAGILNNVNQILNFKNVTGFNLEDADVKSSSGGLTNVDYQVNYDKNNVLNISFIMDYMGAYPSESTKNYSINITSGEIIKPADIFYQNKINDLIGVLNVKLQDNINQKIDLVRKENPSNQVGECSESVINEAMQEGKSYDSNYGKFTEENITGYKITSNSMEFVYNFDFAHVVQACQPNGVVTLSYSQLKDYIRPDGLLGSEIK